ncbi:hypothetical protein DXG01_010707 [Tephrocybe rancida]|nr:hypothetical protein DXG01_010707 [Tephrocybe rancida]
MSTIARYLSSALSRLSLAAPVEPVEAPGTPRTTHSLLSSPVTYSRGLVLSTSPYLKGSAANPKVSLTPATASDATNVSGGSFSDISLTSDTSTSSSYSEDSPQRDSDTNDLFSPQRQARASLLPITPSPPHLVGLGISGVPRKDGKAGNFDGLGLVGVRRSFNPTNPFIVCGEDDDEDNDGYTSPTPIRFRRQEEEEERRDDKLSDTFMRELVFTWEADPHHTRALSTIPECDDEDELEFQEAALMTTRTADSASSSSPEPMSAISSSSPSSAGSCSPSLPSPLPPPSPLTLRNIVRARVSIESKAAVRDKAGSVPPRAPSRNSHHPSSRSKSISAPTRGRTITRAKDPSGLHSGRDEDEQPAPCKKKIVTKSAWRG